MSTKIYSYGARTPTEGLQDILDQLLLAHRYRNHLVTIEIERRDKLQAKQVELFPDLESVQQQLAEIDAQIKAERDLINQERIRLRQRVTRTPTSARIRELQQSRHPLWARGKEIDTQIRGKRDRDREGELNHGRRRTERHEVVWLIPPDPAWADASNTINTEANQKRKALNTSEEFSSEKLSWGTKGRLNETVDPKLPEAPKRRKWSDNLCTGRIAVQIQSGAPLHTSEVFGDDTRVRLERVNPEAKPRQRKSVLWLRIGSDGRQPRWAKIPILLHRPLPDGQIKWVWLLRRRTGTHYKWWVQFTVAMADDQHIGDGKVGLDDGFRKLPEEYPKGEGVRVAAWVDQNNIKDELVLPIQMVRRWDEVKTLQSERTNSFNELKATLIDYLSRTGKVPEWFRTALATLDQWRSPRRLMEFIGSPKPQPEPSRALWTDPAPLAWRDHRFPGDEDIFHQCEEWRHQERKDYDRERHLENHLEHWRDNYFRNEIKAKLSKYDTVNVEDTDRAELQRTPPPEEADNISKHYRKVASPGRFVGLLKEYLQVKRVNPAHSTDTCHDCGEVCTWDRSEREHTCEHCGATWDQDFNAASNLRDR